MDMEPTTPKFIKSITEHPDVQRLIIQIEKLSAENKKLKAMLILILNENFSGQFTLSPYAARQAKQVLKEDPKLCICCEEITEENAHLHRNCGK